MASQPVDTHASDPSPIELAPSPVRALIDPAYDIQDDRVLDIAAAHPDIAALLDEIAARTPAYFPEATGLVIRSHSDPEDGSLSWFIVIQTPISADVATAQLRRFDHEWWLDDGAMVDPELIVTIEPA